MVEEMRDALVECMDSMIHAFGLLGFTDVTVRFEPKARQPWWTARWTDADGFDHVVRSPGWWIDEED